MATTFCDTETGGLNPDGGASPVWEFAAIRRETNGHQVHFHRFLQHDVDLVTVTLPEPFLSDYRARYDPKAAISAEEFTERVAAPAFARDRITGQRPTLVGAVPDFDTAGLRHLMGVSRSASPWHYHIVDVETLMVGWLAGLGIAPQFPWDSDRLSALVGVDPSGFSRHTAMGDVEWTIANYDAVML